MSDPRGGSDSDRDSLTGWTLVDREGTPEPHDPQQDGEGDVIAGARAVEDLEEEEEDEGEEEEDESGCGMEEEEEGEEDLPEDLIHMGQHVQEVKASSGSDSSDIETLEAPGPEEFYQDHCLAYDSLHSSLSSYQSDHSSLRGFAFVRDNAGDADVESLASTTDISVLDDDKDLKDSAAMLGLKDDETDLSLASSPSLPEDLPAIKVQSRKERKLELARGETEPSSPSVVARLMEPFLLSSHSRDWLLSWLPLAWLMQMLWLPLAWLMQVLMMDAQPEEQQKEEVKEELSEAEQEEALVAQLINQEPNQEADQENKEENQQQEKGSDQKLEEVEGDADQEIEGETVPEAGGFQALRRQVLNVWPLSLLRQKEGEEGEEEGEMVEEEAISNETASFSGAWLYDRALQSCSTLEQGYSVVEHKFNALNPWGPDKQYQHTPSSKFNGRLNTIVMLTIATVCGLAIGHFLGWSSRSIWQDSVNSAQVRKLRELQDNLVTCINHGQDSPFDPMEPSIPETSPSPLETSAPHFTNPTPMSKDYFEPETMIHMSASDLRDDVLGYESLVESIIPPLEDAGVVVGSNVQRIETNHYPEIHGYENKRLHRSPVVDKGIKDNVIREDDNEWMGIDFDLPVIHDSKLDLDSLDSDPIFPKPIMDHKWLTEPVFEDNSNYINSRIKTASEITFDSEDIFISKVSKDTKQPDMINHPIKSPVVDFVVKTNLPKKQNTISQSKSIPSVSDLIPDNDYEDDYLLLPLETYKYVNKYEEVPEESNKGNVIISDILNPEEYEDITTSEILSQFENIPCDFEDFQETIPHYNSKTIPSVSDLISEDEYQLLYSKDSSEYEDDLSEAQILINDDQQTDHQRLHTKDSSGFISLKDSDNFISLSSEIEEPTLDLSQDLAAEMPAFVDLVNNQIIDALAVENQELSAEMTRLQQLNLGPIKIQGKSAKESRTLRERISGLINENEELRVAVSKMQFNKDINGDKVAFATLSKENQQKRVAVSKLTHLVPDLKSLKQSANILQVENEELRLNVGKLRYEEPMPRELNALTRELESLKQTVKEAEASKKTPENLAQAKTYVSYMTEVMAALNVLSEFGEGSIVEKMDVAADFFEELAPVGTKIAPAVKRKIEQARAKFGQLRTRLGNKWEQIKTLSKPDNIKAVGTDTLGKMNRVVVNVVNKMKEIGQTTLMKKGKAASDKTAAAMADGFAALDHQFDKTWQMLQAEIKEPVHFKEEMKEVPIKPVEIEEEEEITAEVIEEEEEVVAVAAGDLIRDEPIDTPAPSVTLEKEEQEKEVATKIKKSKEIKDQKRKEKEEKKLEKDKKKKEREADKQKKKEEKRESKEKKGQKKEGKKGKKVEEKQNKKEKEEKNKRFKDAKEKKEVKINSEDDKPYYKGQYNKDEKHTNVKDDDKDNDDDDDDDDFDREKKRQKREESKPRRKVYEDDDRKQAESKMKQRWSKPGRYNMRQENVVSNSKFIRRKGKNSTHESHNKGGRGEWDGKRGKGREESRKQEKRSDWQFDRARDRRDQREQDKKAEWYFDRAQGRKINKYNKGGNVDGYGHNKYENRGTRRRYVRFSDDDDDDSDDERKSKHFGGRHKKKAGHREWVMPNFEYTGKAYHR